MVGRVKNYNLVFQVYSQFSGLIENSELLLMSEAIEADCRRVEIHEG
ncbi:MAG: hypothetical protein R3E08_01080 [Thiotrichaceae bacterium]